ncbi:hypothetical protein B0H15DRAFT_950101 [Mycena belliarum]|uniref:Uncharacterized protein n=1 Tax=Mycena belliarum TaxID=1033014 RepID=A0AAD6U3I6_9AGAR|nr:hypothetical protein B0H15DRAFT_950101 [Mycena belliae]
MCRCSRHNLDDSGTRPGATSITDLDGIDDDSAAWSGASSISNLDGVDDVQPSPPMPLRKIPPMEDILAGTPPRPRCGSGARTGLDAAALPAARSAYSAKVETAAEKKLGH